MAWPCLPPRAQSLLSRFCLTDSPRRLTGPSPVPIPPWAR
jgi:hypothetical protein